MAQQLKRINGPSQRLLGMLQWLDVLIALYALSLRARPLYSKPRQVSTGAFLASSLRSAASFASLGI